MDSSTSELSDLELKRRFAGVEPEAAGSAFEILLKQSEPAMRRLIADRVWIAQDRDDVFQVVCQSALSTRTGFDSEREFEPWIIRITGWRCVDWIRKRLRKTEKPLLESAPLDLIDEPREPTPGPESVLLRVEKKRAERLSLSHAMADFTPQDRTILHLRIIEDLSFPDIRRRTGYTFDIASRINKTLLPKLRRILKNGADNAN